MDYLNSELVSAYKKYISISKVCKYSLTGCSATMNRNLFRYEMIFCANKNGKTISHTHNIEIIFNEQLSIDFLALLNNEIFDFWSLTSFHGHPDIFWHKCNTCLKIYRTSNNKVSKHDICYNCIESYPASFEGGLSRVYLIINEESKMLKIGVSNDPMKRIKKLQTGSSGKLRIVHAIPGNQKTEAMLHKMFSSLRTIGEWFMYDERIVNYFDDWLKESRKGGGVFLTKKDKED